MNSQRWNTPISGLVFCLALAVAETARAQYNPYGHISIPNYYGSIGGYGSSPYGSSPYGSYPYSSSPYGYNFRNGQIGSGYQSAAGLYQQAYRTARPQTTIAFQPLMNLITTVPGWNGPTHRVRSRVRSHPTAPGIRPFDATGKIIWPSAIPDDPATAELRRTAEAAVQTVVAESKSTGHASVRPVIDAKNKLSAFERELLPKVKAKNATDGAAVETFFVALDNALDAMTYVY